MDKRKLKILVLVFVLPFSLISIGFFTWYLSSQSINLEDSSASVSINNFSVTNLSVTPGDQFLKVKWTAAKKATDYRIQYKPSEATVWRIYEDGVSSNTEVSIQNLKNNKSYDVKVTPINKNVIGNSLSVRKITPVFEGYDVFIIAGQSNTMRGKGLDPKIDVAGPRIFQYGRFGENDRKVIVADEPLQHHNNLGSDSIGFGLSFAKAWRNQGNLLPTRRILLLPAGKGATALSVGDEYNWQPGGFLAEDLIERTNEIMNLNAGNRLIALFWQQGERDVGRLNQAEYESTWLTLMSYFDEKIEAFNSETSILIGEMVPSWQRVENGMEDANDQRTVAQKNEINNAHKNLPNLRVNTLFVNSELPTELGMNDEQVINEKNDLIHYSAPSQRKLGKRYYKELLTLRPLCTVFTYSEWSTCSNNVQTRTVLTSSPLNCIGGTLPVLTQICSNKY